MTRVHFCLAEPTAYPRLRAHAAGFHDHLLQIVILAVSKVFGIDTVLLSGASRGRAHVAQARQVAMYLVHCAFGLSHAEVGRLFERDRSTVAHACSLVEDRRDDPVFDRTLYQLEEIVRRLCRTSGLGCILEEA